jgi:tetratricopeptide (TPR) repeat protein
MYRRLQSVLLLVMFGVAWWGCASGPETKPTEPVVVEEEEKPSEEIAPLTEEDRQIKVAAKADSEAEEEEEEEVPGIALPSGKDEETPIPVEAMGEDASRLLATAAQKADTDPEAARKLVEQAVSDNPRCFQCHFSKGVLLEKEGKFAQAAHAYQQALKIHPAHLQSAINLSNLYLRLARHREAQILVSSAVRAAPRDLGLRNQLAAVLLASRQYDKAAEQAKGVLLVDERNVQAMIYLAQAYYYWGKNELAERILLKAKESDDTNALIHNRLGFVYLKMDDMSSAIAAFKKATDLDPNLPEAHNNLGALYNQARDYATATEVLRRAVALAPRFFEAYINLGNALRGGKNFKDAEEAYRRALQVKPDSRRPLFNLGLLYLDDEVPGYDKSARFKLAVDQLEKFKRKGGRHPRLAKYITEARRGAQAQGSRGSSPGGGRAQAQGGRSPSAGRVGEETQRGRGPPLGGARKEAQGRRGPPDGARKEAQGRRGPPPGGAREETQGRRGPSQGPRGKEAQGSRGPAQSAGRKAPQGGRGGKGPGHPRAQVGWRQGRRRSGGDRRRGRRSGGGGGNRGRGGRPERWQGRR